MTEREQMILDKVVEKVTVQKADDNALSALFDGIKYVNTRETALPVTMPMTVQANLWYTYNGKYYVCMPTTGIMRGILTPENFDEMMGEM